MESVFFENIANAICQNLILFSALYIIYFFIKKMTKQQKSAKRYVVILLAFLLIGIGQFFYTLLYGSSIQYFTLVNQIPIGNIEESKNFVAILYLSFLVGLMIINGAGSFNRIAVKTKTEKLKNADLFLYLEDLCSYIQIKVPSIYISKEATVAYVKGVFKKTIILPTAYLSQMTEVEIEAVLLHEIAHIKRFDIYTNWIVVFAETAFYFNPFVKQFAKEIRLQREVACDDWVIQFMKPKHYAVALQKAAQINQMPLQYQKMAFEVPKQQLYYRVKRLFHSSQVNHQFKFNFRPFFIPALFFSFLFFTDVQSYKGFDMVFNHPDTKVITLADDNKEGDLVQNDIQVKGTAQSLNKKNELAEKRVEEKGTSISNTPFTEEAIEFISVTNKTETKPITITLSRNTNKVDDAIFSLMDSTVFYSPLLSNEQFNKIVSSSIQSHLGLIVTSLEKPSSDIICQPETKTLDVRQDNILNVYYNNVLLKSQLRYNQTLNKWLIDFMITNGNEIIASKLIDVTLVKKLKEISL